MSLFCPVISFYQNQYTVAVSESTQPNFVVTKVEARTFPLKHAITYALLSENLKKPATFSINSISGEILLTHRLNRDQVNNYFLEVQASFKVSNTSGGSQYHSAKSFVLINVREQGSEDGLSFSLASYFLKVPCNTSQDTVIYRMRIADSDNIANARLRYRFQKKLDYFSITNNGKIKIQRSLLLLCYLNPSKSFLGIVIVRDTTGIKRNAQASITIVVTPPGPLSREIAGVAADLKDTITRRQTSHPGSGIER